MTTKRQNGVTNALKLQEFFLHLAAQIKTGYSRTDVVRGNYTLMDNLSNADFIFPDGLLITVTVTTPDVYSLKEED